MSYICTSQFFKLYFRSVSETGNTKWLKKWFLLRIRYYFNRIHFSWCLHVQYLCYGYLQGNHIYYSIYYLIIGMVLAKVFVILLSYLYGAKQTLLVSDLSTSHLCLGLFLTHLWVRTGWIHS